MRIELTSGHTAFADDADLDLLLPYSWHLSGKPGVSRLYASARIRGAGPPYKRIKMHRLIMEPPDGMVVHHIDNNGLNNRRANLQITTNRVNIRHACRSGSAHLQNGRWRAVVRDEDGKRISLGMYDTEERARAVVQNWSYRKMLELEVANGMEARHLAEVINNNLAKEA